MTKDGRPSLITDIRLFAGKHSSDLDGQEEAVAFGRRIAWFLNGEGFSLGGFPALYICFTSSLDPSSVRLTDRHGEWWHRYVDVGVPAGFSERADALEIAMRGIVDALLALRPDQADLIDRAYATVREQGPQLRFLLKRHETSKLTVEISSSIEAWPTPSQLFVSHTEKATGVYREADPIDLGFYHEGFALAPGIRLQDAMNLKETSSRPVMSGRVKLR